MALLALPGCQSSPTLAITFGGDIMLAREGNALFAQTDPWESVHVYLMGVKNSNTAALFFANLESPLREAATNNDQSPLTAGYNLCASDSQLSILQEGTVDLVSISNNHNADCGGEGAATTRKLVESAGVAAAGPDLTPIFIETPAGKIAVIAAEDVTKPVSIDELISQIKETRSQCVFLIVSMHWGNEYQAGPSQRQQELAQSIADAGADVLWGHHPHVLQPVTWIKSSLTGKQMLVMYSMGNLLADQWMSADTQRTALVTLHIRDGKIISISVQPYQMDRKTRSLIIPDTDAANQIEKRLGISLLEETQIIPIGKNG